LNSHTFLRGIVIILIEVVGLLAFKLTQFPTRSSYYTHWGSSVISF